MISTSVGQAGGSSCCAWCGPPQVGLPVVAVGCFCCAAHCCCCCCCCCRSAPDLRSYLPEMRSSSKCRSGTKNFFMIHQSSQMEPKLTATSSETPLKGISAHVKWGSCTLKIVTSFAGCFEIKIGSKPEKYKCQCSVWWSKQLCEFPSQSNLPGWGSIQFIWFLG